MAQRYHMGHHGKCCRHPGNGVWISTPPQLLAGNHLSVLLKKIHRRRNTVCKFYDKGPTKCRKLFSAVWVSGLPLVNISGFAEDCEELIPAVVGWSPVHRVGFSSTGQLMQRLKAEGGAASETNAGLTTSIWSNTYVSWILGHAENPWFAIPLEYLLFSGRWIYWTLKLFENLHQLCFP